MGALIVFLTTVYKLAVFYNYKLLKDPFGLQIW
jgi:hypothetical protein